MNWCVIADSIKLHPALFVFGALVGIYVVGYLFYKYDTEACDRRKAEAESAAWARKYKEFEEDMRKEIENVRSTWKRKYEEFEEDMRKEMENVRSTWKRKYEESVELLRVDCMRFPSVMERLDLLLEEEDVRLCRIVSKSAPKAAEKIKAANEERRALRRECMALRTQLEVYRQLAPWLESYMECSLDEVLDALKAEEEWQAAAGGEEPIRRYLTADEYGRLSEVERGQLALERYWTGRVKKNLWLAGLQYERYIGYLYEREGFEVIYHGALKGKEDLGVDLVALRQGVVHVVQCKRYSERKGIPVRENAVAQIYGAARVLQFWEGYLSVVPVLVTSYELSDEARRFAATLGVRVREHVRLEMYPCIKCNVRANGDKIYHLPFDQMYDRVKIVKEKGEFFAMSVQEASAAGFRRAFKWSGK